MAEHHKVTPEWPHPMSCYACNNPLANDEDVMIEDGEVYCMACSQDIGLQSEDLPEGEDQELDERSQG